MEQCFYVCGFEMYILDITQSIQNAPSMGDISTDMTEATIPVRMKLSFIVLVISNGKMKNSNYWQQEIKLHIHYKP